MSSDLHAPVVFPPGDPSYALPIHVLFERCVERLSLADECHVPIDGNALPAGDTSVGRESYRGSNAVVVESASLPAFIEEKRNISLAHSVVAVEDERVSLTYAELNAASDEMATKLVQLGAKLGTVVGIYLQRSAAYVVTLLAILKTGAAYAPLEVAYPPALLRKVVESLCPVAVVTSESLSGLLQASTDSGERGLDACGETNLRRSNSAADAAPSATGHEGGEEEDQANDASPAVLRGYSGALLHVLPADGLVAISAIDKSTIPPRSIDSCSWRSAEAHQAGPETRCYVVFSSGSTGEPKGIEAPHRSPVHSYLWRMGLSGYGIGSRVGCSVFFVWECLRALLSGGTSVVIPDAAAFDAVALLEFLDTSRISEVLLTPSLAENTLSAAGDGAFARARSLERLWLNGEAVSAQLRQRLLASIPPKARLFNTYSISECGEVAACELTAAEETAEAELADKNTVASTAVDNLSQKGQRAMARCGQIASYAEVRVVDDDSISTELDEGELIVSGPGVGTGYFGRPDLTAERFMRDDDGTLWYRTGDTARVDPISHELVVLGRRAHMLKIRGYSVVPGAVEAAIRRVAAVSACIVTVDGDEGSANKRLVAYIVRADRGATADNRILSFEVDAHSGLCPILHNALEAELPSYAVPTVWVELQALPLLAPPLAKVDRSKLPPPPRGSFHHLLGVNEALPLTSVENDAAYGIGVMMGVVLGSPPLASDDSFFAVGGNSLSASRLLALLRSRYAETTAASAITIQALFDHSTPRALAEFLWRSDVADTNFDDARVSASGGEFDSSVTAKFSDDAAKLVARLLADSRNVEGKRRVVLTGATGFVGVGLLFELLNAAHHVTCIVRASSDERANSRMASAVGSEIWFAAVATGRARAIAGDITLPNVGLSSSRFVEVARTCDVIIHAAARVNLLLPYESLYDENVRATSNMLELALAAIAPVRFIFISSTSVAEFSALSGNNHGALVAADQSEKMLPDGKFVDWPSSRHHEPVSGYGQTKRAAEALVIGVARQSPLIQPIIVRLGNVGPSLSAAKDSNPADFTRMLCRACVESDAIPQNFFIEVTPRDVAARTIIALMLARDTPHVAHVVNPSRIDAALLLGPSLEQISVGDFIARLRANGEAIRQRLEPLKGSNSHDSELLSVFDSASMLLSSRASSELLNVPGFSCAATVLASGIGPAMLSASYLKNAFVPPKMPNMLTAVRQASGDREQVLEGIEERVATESRHSPLKGKLVVVLGASSGIGQAIARALVLRGVLVAACARRACADDTGLSIRCDVTKSDDVNKAVNAAEQHYDAQIYAIVNCAGVMYFEYVASDDRQAWQQTVDVNVVGTLNAVGTATQLMLQRKTPGHVVLISSDAGRSAFNGLAVYSGSKFFIEGAARALRRELAPQGIRVTTIQPGNVQTSLASMCRDPAAFAEFGAPSGAKVLDPPDIARAVLYALEQPAHVAVNEVLIEPTGEPI